MAAEELKNKPSGVDEVFDRIARTRKPDLAFWFCFSFFPFLSPGQLRGHGSGVADFLPDGGLLPEAGGGDGQPGEKKQPVGGESLPEPAVPLALQGDDDSSGGGGGEGGPGDAAAGSRQAQNQGVEKGFPPRAAVKAVHSSPARAAS